MSGYILLDRLILWLNIKLSKQIWFYEWFYNNYHNEVRISLDTNEVGVDRYICVRSIIYYSTKYRQFCYRFDFYIIAIVRVQTRFKQWQ